MSRPYRILLVDDTPSVRSSVKELLGALDEEFDIVEAENGARALKIVAPRGPEALRQKQIRRS